MNAACVESKKQKRRLVSAPGAKKFTTAAKNARKKITGCTKGIV